MSLSCIILAGGSSSRFPSPIPKVFYPFIDKPLIEHIFEALFPYTFDKIIVVTGERSHDRFEAYENAGLIERAYQQQPLGTWDALKTALPRIKTSECLVINGDLPLINSKLIQDIMVSAAPLTLVSTLHPDPDGYGRIIRDRQGVFTAVIEDKHLSYEQRMIREINAGIYKFNVGLLTSRAEQHHQAGREFYLTDLWEEASSAASLTEIIIYNDHRVLIGINTWSDFERAEDYYFQLQRERLVMQGAILKNTSSIYAVGNVQVSADSVIEGPAVLKGNVILGKKTTIQSLTILKDSSLGDHVEVGAFSLLDHMEAHHNASLGPYLKASEKTKIDEAAALGSFVEVKRSHIGKKTKAKHLSYIADATIGESCNLGAFVVFCNYDGKNKHHTILGDHVFVGSSSQLVSPIILKDKAYIGAGTTVTCNVDENTLMTRRASIKMIANWGEKRKCVES